MDPLQAVIYGVVQGLAWFIPISSDAHLEILSVLLSGHDIGAPVTAVIQWGTWVACVIYFWKDIGRYTRAFMLGLWENRPLATQDAKLAWMLLVGTVPIGVLGILFKHYIETEWRKLIVVALAAIVFALLLAAAEWFHRIRGRAGKPEKDLSDLGWGETLLVGFAQCVALIPGASRSGTTISAGIFAGMSRDAAARYSFLLSLPAVLAAGLYELVKHQKELLQSQQDVLSLVIATVTAGVVGYASIAFLIRFLKTHSTWVFIGYRLLFGVVLLVLVWQGILPNQPPVAPTSSPKAAETLSPLSPVLRGEGSGVRGSAFRNQAPSPPTPLPRSTGGEGRKSPRKDFPDFARTNLPGRRLYYTGAETVSPPWFILRWPVVNAEE